MVFDKIRGIFSGDAKKGSPRRQRDREGLYFHVKCGKCGTPVRVRGDKRHDLQRDYDRGGYTLNKDVLDSQCYNLFHFTVRLDENYNVVEREIEGGEFITAEEYKELTHIAKE